MEPREYRVGDLGAVDVLVYVVGLDGEVSPIVETVSLEDEGVNAFVWNINGLGKD